MKSLFLTLALVLQGCALHTPLNQVPGFNPVTVPDNQTEKFRQDHRHCMAETHRDWPNALQENAAVFQYRRCLIDKGYVLLSQKRRSPSEETEAISPSSFQGA